MFGNVGIALGKHLVNLQKFSESAKILEAAPILSECVEVAQHEKLPDV